MHPHVVRFNSSSNTMLKLKKVFECSCIDGFTGDFCEFKTEQDHLLFVDYKLVFNADGRMIEENAILEQQVEVWGSCSTILNGQAIIFGGSGRTSNIYRQVHFIKICIGLKYHPFQISVVSDCTVKRLGDLPFDFNEGTCGTFMIESLPTILLCFDWYVERKCRSLTKRNDGALSDIKDFAFDSEFQIDKIVIPDSTHDHYGAKIANYQGYPLILGGYDSNKLEMLNIMENPPRWIEYAGTDYPYSNS